MTSPLDRIFETKQHLIRIAEILGIANQATDSREEFANKCILSTFNLTRDQCKEIFHNHYHLLPLHPSSPWETALPLRDECLEVFTVKKVWTNTMSSLNKEFSKALYVLKFKEKFGDDDPIKAIFEDLNDRFSQGSASLQSDLKPVLSIIKEHQFLIIAGVGQLAWTLREDDKDYAFKVANAFASRAIPQKGLSFALTLIASLGGAPVQFAPYQLQNIKLLLEASPDELHTGINSRLSETKTVLRELGLADIPPNRHKAAPRFKPEAKELLTKLISNLY